MQVNITGELAKRKELAERKAKSTPKKKVKEITVRRGAEGGFIAKHHYEHNGEYHEPDEYPLKSHNEMMRHMKEHMGE